MSWITEQEVKEFRIGNYLLLNGIPEKIWGIDLDLRDEGTPLISIGKHDVEPINSFKEGELIKIPLTEEWLLKFGFEYCEFPVSDEDGVYRDKTKVNKDYFKHPRLPEEISIYLPYNHFNYHIGSVTIKHVHQLQNLYFALTGEELKIND